MSPRDPDTDAPDSSAAAPAPVPDGLARVEGTRIEQPRSEQVRADDGPLVRMERRHAADELDPRARAILKAVVQGYADTGEPVASNVLARQAGIALSPASVRAVLADLEALGFLGKPHTSAGRVPTDKGYRFYVDVLVRMRQVGGRDKDLIDTAFDPARTLPAADELVADTSRLLHALTRYAGVVTRSREQETFRTIDFVRLREDRVLAVCVTGTGAVRNRLLTIDRPVDQADLDRAAQYVNELLGTGRTLDDARAELALRVRAERETADSLAARALDLGTRALAAASQPSGAPVLVDGESSLAADPTLGDGERLRALFRALAEKERFAHLLERVSEAGELTLVLGEEIGLSGAENLAVVASPYGRGGERLGAIGVIGPARMAYGRIIPLVEYTAKALSRTLDDA